MMTDFTVRVDESIPGQHQVKSYDHKMTDMIKIQ